MDRDRITGLFSRLVSIDSVSFEEREMADVLTAELRELGFEVSEDKAGEAYGSDTGNIYGFLKGNNVNKRPVLFSAHMDTVVPGKGKRAVIDEETGRITSAGDTVLGGDDVAGIVNILEGVRAAMDDPDGHGDIEVLFTAAEEVYCRGSRLFDYSVIRSRAAFVMDMSSPVGMAAFAAPTLISFMFEVTGRPAHAGFDPASGINAIAIASDIISSTRQGLLDNGLTLNIGTIEGGSAANIVSEKCKCIGEVRSGDHDAAVRAVEELRSRTETICRGAGAELKFESEVMIHAYRTPETAEACRIFRQVCSEMGLSGELVPTRGGSDNNYFAQHGIEGIVVSCGMMNTHATDEYIYVDDLVKGCELVAKIISLM